MTDATVKKLGIRDRLIIPNILPQQGGLVAQRVCKDIRKKVGISQAEMKSANMRDVRLPNGTTSVTWDTEKVEKGPDGEEIRTPIEELVIEVAFTSAELKIISGEISRLDKQERITQEILETCEKFLDPGPADDTPEKTE